MLPDNHELFILFLTGLIITSALTPLMRLIAIKYGIVDTPNQEHKTHNSPVPYLGGIAIVLGTTLTTYTAAFFSRESNYVYLLSSIALPALMLSLIGLIDDMQQLAPLPRFVAQNLIAIVATILIISFEFLGSPLGISVLDFAITVLWLVGITNSINFLDNIDGGAAGIAIFIAISLFIMSFLNNQLLVASITLVLAGSLFGFLVWNKLPAKIFMGDSGSLFIGFLLSSLAVRLDTSINESLLNFWIVAFLFALPLLDTSLVIRSRISRGVSIFQGGRDHLSHRLLAMGLSKINTIRILLCLAFVFCSFSLLVFTTEGVSKMFWVSLGSIVWLVIFHLFSSRYFVET